MKTLKLLLSLTLSFSLTALYAQVPNILSSYANGANTFTISTIANSSDQISKPRDLDFQPKNGQLWVVNTGTENSGGSTVRIDNPNETNQTTLWQRDGNAWHFMSLPSGIAFGDNENFGTSSAVYDANHDGGQPFAGPALWSSDPLIYAKPSGGNGSHLDMLHESSYAMGIAWETGNAYWLTDMNHGDVVRYDFVADHGPGAAYHDDGKVRRFQGQTISWVNQNVSSHLDLDAAKKWLYVVDGGGKRVIRLDITTGTAGAAPGYPQFENLAEYTGVTGATWEVVTNTNLVEPSGIAVLGTNLLVSDHSTGDIIVYDISSMPAQEVNRIPTAAGIQGITIGPDGRIWFVNATTNIVGRIEPAVVTKVDNFITNSNLLNIFPNPSEGEFQLNLDGLDSEANLSITSMNGQTVYDTQLQKANNKLNVSHLNAGIYFIKVNNEKFNIAKKLIIQ